MKNKSISAWIDEEITTFKKVAKHSKIKFFFLASINILTNIATVTTAVIAIWLLLKMSKNYSYVGVVLASLSASSAIILFFIHLFIVIYRSFMKSSFYENAIHKIELEFMKYNTKQGKYVNKDANSLLLKKVNQIKKTTLEKRINKKAKSIIVKSLMGDANA